MSLKNAGQLFPGAVCDWNELQLHFYSWLSFYHSIYTGEERPSDKIIESDLELDSWLKTRRLKQEAEARKMKLDSMAPQRGRTNESFSF